MLENEFVSLDEHEIWFSCTRKIPNEKIEDAIELFLNGAESVEFDDDMSDEEIEYIRNEVRRRGGK